MRLESEPGLSRPKLRQSSRPAARSGYEIALDVCDGVATLVLTGALDASAANALSEIIGYTDDVDCEVVVEAAGVTAVQPYSLDAIVRAAQRRARAGTPAVVLSETSPPVAELLKQLAEAGELPPSLRS